MAVQRVHQCNRVCGRQEYCKFEGVPNFVQASVSQSRLTRIRRIVLCLMNSSSGRWSCCPRRGTVGSAVVAEWLIMYFSR